VISGQPHAPSDGEIRGNYLRKLAAWNSKGWNNTKNQFEMKSGQRILFEGNVVDTTYRQAQETSINIKIGDEDPANFVHNVTIRKNIIRHTANGIKVCASQCNSTNNTNIATGIAVYNNIFDHVRNSFGDSTDGNGFTHIVTGPFVYVDHNTFLNQNEGVYLFVRGVGVSNGQTLAITNNIWLSQANPLTGGEVTAVSSAANYTNNLIVGSNCANYPGGNRCPSSWEAVGFVNFNGGNGGDYTLSASSPYKGVGSDPFGVGTTDPGANVAAVNTATACAVSGQCGSVVVPPPTPSGAMAVPRTPVQRRYWISPGAATSTTVTAASATSSASALTSWTLGLAARAEANVAGLYVYAQRADGTTSDGPTFLAALSPADARSATPARLFLRARFRNAVADLKAGTYTVTVFSQSKLGGAPVEVESITIMVR
jgi:hypothetical protein